MFPPRPISTEKRREQLEQIKTFFTTKGVKLQAIIDDLSKPHVDDKGFAKKVKAEALKIQKFIGGLSS